MTSHLKIFWRFFEVQIIDRTRNLKLYQCKKLFLMLGKFKFKSLNKSFYKSTNTNKYYNFCSMGKLIK